MTRVVIRHVRGMKKDAHSSTRVLASPLHCFSCSSSSFPSSFSPPPIILVRVRGGGRMRTRRRRRNTSRRAFPHARACVSSALLLRCTRRGVRATRNCLQLSILATYRLPILFDSLASPPSSIASSIPHLPLFHPSCRLRKSIGRTGTLATSSTFMCGACGGSASSRRSGRQSRTRSHGHRLQVNLGIGSL